MGSFLQQARRCSLWLFGWLWLVGSTSTAIGQIVPDTTLPNNTVVIPNGNISIIGQGTQVGSNLFHSFLEFSIPTGSAAFFNNAPNIQNIINRVTGPNSSNIDGTIAANGTANVFLINPNGIIFGANAQLAIGGSFISSTANSLKFADGGEFSATNPQAPPLLVINVPIGLQFGSNPKSIINRSQATSPVPLPPLDPSIPIPSNVGLQVQPGRTLALIGGDLILEGGNLTAFSGDIHLGSVASPGMVGFIPIATGLVFDYSGFQIFGNIALSGTASVTTSGLGGGAIRVRGGNVTLRDRSNLVSDTLGSLDGRGITIEAAQFQLENQALVAAASVGTGAGGNIAIRTTDSVELRGIGFDNFQQQTIAPILTGALPNLFNRESTISTGTIGAGKAGNITIETRQLTLREGAMILSPTFGTGAGGNIGIRASEVTDISASGVFTSAFNQGKAGALSIDTGRLILRDQALVSTATLGTGDGGDITVTASDSVTLSEFTETSQFGTSLSTSTAGSTGKAGNLTIDTRTLLLEGGATISSSSGLTPASGIIPSFGRGGDITINASDSVIVRGTSNGNPPSRSQLVTATLGSAESGDLRINTRQLIIQDGGGVGASTVGSGKGGDVIINASELVEVAGRTQNGVSPSGLATASGDALLASFYPGQLNPTGAAGNIYVTTGRLIVRDGASVNVQSVGEGAAGTINVVADAIALDNGGSIDASTGSGAGGNIFLTAPDIRLRRQSIIRTNAENTQGGNITINTDTLVAVPVENSDITANAQEGPGGRVSITAQGIFGTQFRDRLTPESDITATSKLGPEFNGTVIIDIRGIDPATGLAQLPENLTEASQLIATGCPADVGSSLTITGRGGLPEDPTGILLGRTVWRDLRLTNNSNRAGEQGRIPQSQSPEPNQQPTPLVEAQGWVLYNDGRVELVADASRATPQNSWHRSQTCDMLNSP